MSGSSISFPNVTLANGVEVDDFVVLGRAPKGAQAGELPLTIGAGSVLRSHSVIYAGSRIGDRFQCGHGALIRENCELGNDCSVGSGTVLEFHVKVGNGVRIHSKCFVPEHSILEDDCWLGPNVVLTNAPYPVSKRVKDTLEGVRICAKAIIGANATILPGVTVGPGAIVGAGSVVTHDIAPGTVVVGNPARAIGLRQDLRYRDTGLPAYEDNLT